MVPAPAAEQERLLDVGCTWRTRGPNALYQPLDCINAQEMLPGGCDQQNRRRKRDQSREGLVSN
jgi:hypothetical protein